MHCSWERVDIGICVGQTDIFSRPDPNHRRILTAIEPERSLASAGIVDCFQKQGGAGLRWVGELDRLGYIYGGCPVLCCSQVHTTEQAKTDKTSEGALDGFRETKRNHGVLPPAHAR